MENKNKFYLALTIFFISIVLFFASLYLRYGLFLELEKVDASFIVRESLDDVNVNISSLNFGVLKPGSKSSIEIVVFNDYGFPVIGEFTAEGDSRDFLNFQGYNYFKINQYTTIKASAIVPLATEPGDYYGAIIMRFKKDF